MSTSRSRLGTLAALVLLTGAACGGNPLDEITQLQVNMVDVAFEPARIEIAAGEPVALMVSNEGVLEHDLDLPAAGLHVHGYPGARQAALLMIDEPGVYEALCLTPGHADAGMRMQVVVR